MFGPIPPCDESTMTDDLDTTATTINSDSVNISISGQSAFTRCFRAIDESQKLCNNLLREIGEHKSNEHNVSFVSSVKSIPIRTVVDSDKQYDESSVCNVLKELDDQQE